MNSEQETLALLENSARQFISDQLEQSNSETDIWPMMAELGWLGIALPEELGGLGLGIAEITALTRLFGQAALSTRFIGQSVLPSLVLANNEVSGSITELTEAFVMGTTRLSLAWQENRGIIDPALITARLNQGGLTGRKVFVAGVDQADYYLVSCLANQEPAIVLVEKNANGVTCAVASESSGGFGELIFDNVSVDDSDIILTGSAAISALTASIEHGQMAIAAELEGLADGCLNKTVEYLKTRRQFNQALGSFQAIRHRCADLLIQNRLAESSWRRAVREYQTASASGQINAAKARCADAAFKVAKESVQMHGAMGFTEEAGIGSYLRSAIGLSSWLGSASQHRQQLLLATQPELCRHA